MIRIILFDDSSRFRKSLEDFFEESAQIYIAASFADANQVIKRIKDYNPDVVLMDIRMPGVSGLEALQTVQQARLETKILMLTSFDDEEKIFSALCNSAFGYVLKSSTIEEIQEAIMEVHSGGRYLTPSLATKVYKLMQNHMVQAQPTYVAFTERQKAVLQAMVDGLSRKMIAEKLGIGLDTVGDHLKDIYRKLHVNSAPEAVREAIQRKIV